MRASTILEAACHVAFTHTYRVPETRAYTHEDMGSLEARAGWHLVDVGEV